jgi:4-hydroxybenzoate decarboxylase subunit C
MNKTGIYDLRAFLKRLEAEGELHVIDAEVDPRLELAEVHRRVVGAGGPALLFRHVLGSPFPVVTNLFGSEKRIELAFPDKPERFVETMVKMLTHEFPPSLGDLWQKRGEIKKLLKLGTKKVKRGAVIERTLNPHDLELLPILKCWPDDGGHFVTLPLVYTEPVGGGPSNLGMYRIQRMGKAKTGLHFQIGKGGGFHFHEAEKLGKALPVSIFLGGPPALIFSAICPLPENVPELIFASLLQGSKVDVVMDGEHPHPLIANCEFALVGEARPHERALEGPFGDHYGYYGMAHDYPVFHCKRVYHRKDAIYPATVVGKPIQEDLFIGHYLQKLLSPLIKTVMPAVKSLWSYGETGFHPLSCAIVKERYEKEALASAFRILGEGQLSLTKFLIVTDQNVDFKNVKSMFETVLARFRPECDLYIFSHTSNDTLDYTGPKVNHGSKAVLMGLGEEKRKLPGHFSGRLPMLVTHAEVYCRGCLVIQGPSYESFSDPSLFAQHIDFREFPLIVLVDDAKSAASSDLEFLWQVFTRFDPASDMYMNDAKVLRHHISYKAPILIDARMKPSYPKEALVDDMTKELVDKKWNRYSIPCK